MIDCKEVIRIYLSSLLSTKNYYLDLPDLKNLDFITSNLPKTRLELGFEPAFMPSNQQWPMEIMTNCGSDEIILSFGE